MKPDLDHQDLEELLEFLWKHDRYEFVKRRFCPQLAFYLLTLAFTAARPGAVVVSSCYRDSNQALTYGVYLTFFKPSSV